MTLNPRWKRHFDNYDFSSGIIFTNVTDANGRITKSGYDALGHLVQTIDAAGNITTFTYQNNLLKKITDANGNATTYTYDANRNLSGTSFPDGTNEAYFTGNDGVLHSKRDRKGQGVSYSCDSFGRVVGVLWPGASQVYKYAGTKHRAESCGDRRL